MHLIIEWDGVISDVRPAYVEAHAAATAAVGWSRLDDAAFWRLTRTRGEGANVLPGAPPAKLKHYSRHFSHSLAGYLPAVPALGGMDEWLAQLARFAALTAVTLIPLTESEACPQGMRPGAVSHLREPIRHLSSDPRTRPQELRRIAGGDRRTVVVAAGDQLARSADAAGLFVVGITTGPCTSERLFRAGARVVWKSMADLVASMKRGARELVEAGLLPGTDSCN